VKPDAIPHRNHRFDQLECRVGGGALGAGAGRQGKSG